MDQLDILGFCHDSRALPPHAQIQGHAAERGRPRLSRFCLGISSFPWFYQLAYHFRSPLLRGISCACSVSARSTLSCWERRTKPISRRPWKIRWQVTICSFPINFGLERLLITPAINLTRISKLKHDIQNTTSKLPSISSNVQNVSHISE